MNRIIVIATAVSVLCSWGSSVMADTAPLKKVSLEKAVKIALKTNSEYLIAKQKEEAAQEDVNRVWGSLMPALESEAAVLRQKADTGTMSLADGMYELKIAQLRFGVNPGGFYHSLKAAKEGRKMAVEEVRRVRFSVTYRVIESYYNCILADEMVKLRKESLVVLKKNLRDVRNLFRTGTVPKYQLLQAQVKVQAQEPLVIEAENNHESALDIFNYTLGANGRRYAVSSEIDISLIKMPDPAIDAVVKRITAIALKNRPEVVQLSSVKKLRGHAGKASASMYLWPTFSIGGYYGYNKSDPNEINLGMSSPMVSPDFSRITGDGKWQAAWQVRAAATYRWGALFPSDPNRAEERKKDAQVKEAVQELDRLKRLIAIGLRSSYTELVASYKTIKSRKKNVATAREGLRIARISFKAGGITNSDFLSAQLALSQAKAGYIRSINKYHTALAKIQRDMGTDDISIIFNGGPK